MNQSEKKKTGSFYTENKMISKELITFITKDKNPDIKYKILEPSVGCASIICHIMNFIYETFSKNELDVFLKRIIINDIKKEVSEKGLSRISLLYKKWTNTKLKIKVENYNIDFIENGKFFKSKNIKHIIGNPPYVSLYGRRDQKRNEKQRQEILLAFDQFPIYIKNGKINYSMLFIENSLNLLDSNDSTLSFIVDGNFNEDPYSFIRTYIYKKGFCLTKIVKNICSFKNVVSGQMIISISKKNNHNNVIIKDFHTKEKWTLKQNDFIINKDFKMQLNKPNKILSNAIFKILSKTMQYKEIYDPKSVSTCSMLLNLEREFVEPYYYDNLNINQFYYLKGSKSLIDNYKIKNPEYILNYDIEKAFIINEGIKEVLEKQKVKNKKRIMLGKKERFALPKIFIRQSSKKLITSYSELCSTSNNSLYMLTDTKKQKFAKNELYFLDGYFNSAIATFLVQYFGYIRYFKGKQPQMKISDFIKLPVIYDNKIKNDISKISELISASNIETSKPINEIDNILFSFFKLTNIEIKEIKNFSELF